MLFNVSGLVQEGIGANREYDVEGELPSDSGEPERVAGTAEMIGVPGGVLVRARLHLVEPETCSRCLRPLDQTIAIEFEEEFRATIDAKTGRPLPQGDEPEAFQIDAHHMLDLTEAVRQYREVSRTMQPLCRPDCRGLCPACGKDLNEGDCECDSGPVDDRWAGLAALRDARPEGKDS
jgi:uncharacterized protein